MKVDAGELISDESEAFLEKDLSERRFEYVMNGFLLGGVSFHYGWTYHRAEPNRSNLMRKAMTIIYMDEQMMVKESGRTEQVTDQKAFIPDRLLGEPADTALNPRLYP